MHKPRTHSVSPRLPSSRRSATNAMHAAVSVGAGATEAVAPNARASTSTSTGSMRTGSVSRARSRCRSLDRATTASRGSRGRRAGVAAKDTRPPERAPCQQTNTEPSEPRAPLAPALVRPRRQVANRAGAAVSLTVLGASLPSGPTLAIGTVFSLRHEPSRPRAPAYLRALALRASNPAPGRPERAAPTSALIVLRLQQLRDRLQLHVAGAFVDLADLGVAIEFLDGVVFGEADAAEELDCERGAAFGDLGGG
jgi:hypothetical protein